MADAVALAQKQLSEQIKIARDAQKAAQAVASREQQSAQAAIQAAREAEAKASAAQARAQTERAAAAAARAEMERQRAGGVGPKFRAANAAAKKAEAAAAAAEAQANQAQSRAAQARQDASGARQRAEKASTRADTALKSLDRIRTQGSKAVERAAAIEAKKRKDAAEKAAAEANRKLVAQGAGVAVATSAIVGTEVMDARTGGSMAKKNAKLGEIAKKIEALLPKATRKGKASAAARSQIKGLVDAAKGLTNTGAVARIRAQPKLVGGGAALLATSFYFESKAAGLRAAGDEDTARLMETFAMGERAAGVILVGKSAVVSIIGQAKVDEVARGVVLGAKQTLADQAKALAQGAKSKSEAKARAVSSTISDETRKSLDARKAAKAATAQKELTPKQIAAKKAWETRRARGTTNTGRSGPAPAGNSPDPKDVLVSKDAAKASKGAAGDPVGWSDDARKASAKSRGVKLGAVAKGVKTNALVGVGIAAALYASGFASKAEAADIATAGGVSEFERAKAQGSSSVFSGLRAAAFSVAQAVSFGTFGAVRDALVEQGKAIREGKGFARHQGRTKVAGAAADLRTPAEQAADAAKSAANSGDAGEQVLGLRALAKEQAETRAETVSQASIADQFSGQSEVTETYGERIAVASGTVAMYPAAPTPEHQAQSQFKMMSSDGAREAAGRSPVPVAKQPPKQTPPAASGSRLRGFADPRVQAAAQKGRRRK